MKTLLLRRGNLIDGTGTPVRPVAGIVVEDGKFKAIHDDPSAEGWSAVAADEEIDLNGAYVLPGLFEAHAHLGMTFPQENWPKTPHHELPADRTIRAGRGAMDALQHGITTVCVLGEPHYLDVAWKKAFASGMFTGPRLFVSCRPIIATGGHGHEVGDAVEVDGVAEVRKAVREQMRRGADFVKIQITGGVSSRTETMYECQMTLDEMQAAVEVARMKGRKVRAHCCGPVATKLAVQAGVSCIEHGYFLDDEAVAMMAEHGTFYVPTLAVTRDEAYIRANWRDYAIEKGLESGPAHLESFQKALRAGVKIAAGDDLVPFAERLVPELETLVSAGMGPMAAIMAATRVTAELCDAEDRLGTVEPGKIADFIVVARNPVENISHLREVRMVFKEGKLVVDKRPSSE